jgi:hypothetical protein
MEADFGKPQWTFGTATYAFQSEQMLVVTWAEEGRWRMGLLSLEPRRLERVQLTVEPLDSVVATTRAAYFVGGSPTQPAAITRVTFGGLEAEMLKPSSEDALEARFVSAAEAVTFDSAGQPTHAFYYPPRNPDFSAPDGTRPPLLVLSHGGPTGATNAVYDPEVQFWTTRGFAVIDVNYGHRRCPRCGERRQTPRGRRARRSGASHHPRRQRRRLHHAGGADVPRHLHGRRQLLRHQRSRGARARHAQVRSARPFTSWIA